jgi:hypothetical protein
MDSFEHLKKVIEVFFLMRAKLPYFSFPTTRPYNISKTTSAEEEASGPEL